MSDNWKEIEPIQVFFVSNRSIYCVFMKLIYSCLSKSLCKQTSTLMIFQNDSAS